MQRAHGIGRLAFGRRGDVTVVSRCYQEAGLRIRMPRVEPGAAMEAVVINTAGGLTGGDRFSLDIEAASGTRAVVTTQAAEKVYRSSGGIGTFDTHITVGAGAAIEWLPQEAILFDGSALERRLSIDMAADASVLAVESIVFGRLARGERIDSGYLFDRWRIRRGGRLIYAEGLRLEGPITDRLSQRACGAGAAAGASLVWVSPLAEAAIGSFRDGLARPDDRGVEAGVSAFDGMLALRMVAVDPFALRSALKDILERARGPLPRVWSC